MNPSCSAAVLLLPDVGGMKEKEKIKAVLSAPHHLQNSNQPGRVSRAHRQPRQASLGLINEASVSPRLRGLLA